MGEFETRGAVAAEGDIIPAWAGRLERLACLLRDGAKA